MLTIAAINMQWEFEVEFARDQKTSHKTGQVASRKIDIAKCNINEEP